MYTTLRSKYTKPHLKQAKIIYCGDIKNCWYVLKRWTPFIGSRSCLLRFSAPLWEKRTRREEITCRPFGLFERLGRCSQTIRGCKTLFINWREPKYHRDQRSRLKSP